MARMFGMKSKSLHYLYQHHLSDYKKETKEETWKREKVLTKFDIHTGEVLEEKPLYVCKPEHVGEHMCIDDKQIGKGGFTILSNQQTGKIAMLMESVNGEELSQALSAYLPQVGTQVTSISSDMSPTYLKLCREQFTNAQIVIDKFHVIRYVYDAVSEIRLRIKREETEKLSKGKSQTTQDTNVLSNLEVLKRCRHTLNQSKEDWSFEQTYYMDILFDRFQELKVAYDLAQDFKSWYSKENVGRHRIITEQLLYQWYEDVEISGLKEFKSVTKMIEKHEENIINYFNNADTNAKAERTNGKIKRFIANNYGMRNKDFALYRIKGYFS